MTQKRTARKKPTHSFGHAILSTDKEICDVRGLKVTSTDWMHIELSNGTTIKMDARAIACVKLLLKTLPGEQPPWGEAAKKSAAKVTGKGR
jgi:hypothetical protein